MNKKFLILMLATTFIHPQAFAQEIMPENTKTSNCADAMNRECLIKELDQTTAKIDNISWRDQTYRELAKTYAFDGKIDEGIALLQKIENSDTKAMTIRGMGMASADQDYSPEEYKSIFSKLRAAAEKIDHPPSYAIALTYIAMSQAFAGDNEGSWATAADMENDSLRHKAYGETAEIQAEKGDYASAKISISRIESPSYRDKANQNISKILTDRKKFNEAYDAALLIDNPYKKAQSIQYILDGQKPREIPHQ